MSWMFSSDELTALRTAHTDHYNDRCKIGTYTDAGADAYGNPNPSWVLGSEIACGFLMMKNDEALETADVPIGDAQVRLPVGTVITSQDRVQIIKRQLSTLATPELYSVIGEPKRGATGLVVTLELVTDGS